MTKINEIVVGFSGNAEIAVCFDRASESPKMMADIYLTLGGGAVNVAQTIKAVTRRRISVKLFIATGADHENNFKDTLLSQELGNNGLDNWEFLRIREPGKTGLAVRLQPSLGVTQILGEKGKMNHLSARELSTVSRYIRQHPQAIRIATGVNEDEVALLKLFFGIAPNGSCVLNPRDNFARSSTFLSVVRLVDVLYWNSFECGCFLGKDPGQITPEDYLAAGKMTNVPLMIVTRNSQGVVIYHQGKLYDLPSYKKGRCISDVSAGDCWLGAFVAYAAQKGITSLARMSLPTIFSAAEYATVVAGLKVTSQEGWGGIKPEIVTRHIKKYRTRRSA